MLLPKHRQLVGTSHYVAIATFYASTFISFAKIRKKSETTKLFSVFLGSEHIYVPLRSNYLVERNFQLGKLLIIENMLSSDSIS